MLTDKVKYKIYIQAQEYIINEGKQTNFLSISFYIFSDYNKEEILHGINIQGDPKSDYEEAVKSIAPLIDRWLENKYSVKNNSYEYFINNNKIKERFDRFLQCKIDSLINIATTVIESNYNEQ